MDENFARNNILIEDQQEVVEELQIELHQLPQQTTEELPLELIAKPQVSQLIAAKLKPRFSLSTRVHYL
jgi:hypothetical protein